jgi:uncharacterized protein
MSDQVQSNRPKYIPERTCVACRRSSGKRDLVRLVRAEGAVEVDPRGKKPGRGVYLCPNRECWDMGLKGNRIEFGLRTKLSSENRQYLFEYCKSLPEKEDN